MKSIFFKAAAFVAILSFNFACEKKDMDDLTGTGNLVLEFDNRIGSTDLVLGETKATNASGEEFTLTTLNYFISNIQLMDMAGNMISFPDQYFLVRESDPSSQKITLTDIPAGNYHHLTYTIGVDSLKSISDVSQRTGVLDPASYGNDNMYWSWNMGYIFFKMEGLSEASSREGNVFQFHIGGFGGKDAPTPNNLKVVENHMTDMVKIRRNETPTSHIIMDVSKVFDGENAIQLAVTPMIHNPKVGTTVAANYVNAFNVDHVH